MKNFILISSIIFSISFSVSAQEIIKTKSIEQIEIIPVPFIFLNRGNQNSLIDSSKMIRIYCGVTKVDSTKMPLYLIKNKEKYYKFNLEELSKPLNPNWIVNFDVIKNKEDLYKYGIEGQFGIIIIKFKEEFISEILSSLKVIEYKISE